MLAGKRIVLGVTGGIAAYKAVEICRRLVDAGAHVIPVMTKGSEHFLGITTLSALASEPVQTSLWSEATPIPHTALGQSADLVVVAPATARLIGAYAAGLSTDLLTNILLATRAPVIVCRRCTPRCGSTRRLPTTSPPCVVGVFTSSSPTRVDWPGATWAGAGSRRPNGSSPKSSGFSAVAP